MGLCTGSQSFSLFIGVITGKILAHDNYHIFGMEHNSSVRYGDATLGFLVLESE